MEQKIWGFSIKPGESEITPPGIFFDRKESLMDYLRTTDRRSRTRFPLSLSVQCFDQETRTEIISRTADISEQGMGLLINEEVRLGGSIVVTITMPDTGEEIRVKGKFIWQKPIDNYQYRTGLALTGSMLKPVSIALRTLQARSLSSAFSSR